MLVCHSLRTASTSVWYIDSGTSKHMTSVSENFTDLTESDVDLDVELGNDSKVKAVGRGTVSFQREFQQPMVVRDVFMFWG